MYFSRQCLFVVMTLAFAGASPSVAQDAVRSACMNDIKTLCASEYKARSRDKVRVCLQAKVDKTTPKCQSAVRAQMAANKQNAPTPGR